MPWGRAELVDYKNSHGERLQGALYYPANYERGKQYPMIVQIYEIMSTQLHNWTAPSERATYNAAVWTQNGYFVYRPGYRLPSARARPFGAGLRHVGREEGAGKRHDRRQAGRAGGPFLGRIRDHLPADAD